MKNDKHRANLYSQRVQRAILKKQIKKEQEETDASRQNSATTNARSMSYRYTGVMLCQALGGVQRQL